MPESFHTNGEYKFFNPKITFVKKLKLKNIKNNKIYDMNFKPSGFTQIILIFDIL